LKNEFSGFSRDFAWRPTPAHIQRANLTHFMDQHGIADFNDLMLRSTRDVNWFTDAIIKWLKIQFFTPYTQAVDLSHGIQEPVWCPGGELNIVHNLLDKYQGTPTWKQPAFHWENEIGDSVSFTYEQCFTRVNKIVNALRSLGIKKGDSIAIFMPMIPETVLAMLAIARMGAIIVPMFSGYGVGAVAARLVDANVVALFTADGGTRRGKINDMKSIADEAAGQVPTLKYMIVIKNTGRSISMVSGRDHWWSELIEPQPEYAQIEITSAEDALMILYTSGTTGKPKGVLHTHCGFPIKAAQDMAFGTDVHPEDLIYWVTDLGWMMGPWLVFGALLLGATFLIYDGALDHPSPERIWQLVAKHHITTLGISPSLVRSLIPHGDELFLKHDRSSLRFFASTGEPWDPASWMWLFEKPGEGFRPIINYSGGTEISGGILMGNPILPVKPCAFAGPCPGISADVYNENGLPIRNEVGELVIRNPWIGMTRGFWKDGQRYLDTYWSRWENTWTHGDFAMIDLDGNWYILGRSDDTIKIAGKRLGPAEVESILMHHPSVLEAAAIGVPHEIHGNELILFVVLKRGIHPEETLRSEIRDHIIIELGKPLAPGRIIFISDLPKTRNTKVMRRVIRSAYLGIDLGDISSLLNPECVQEIINSRIKK
jgi:acetyl-CoA synthetase